MVYSRPLILLSIFLLDGILPSQAFDVHERSLGSSSKDPGHQHPERFPPHLRELAHAGFVSEHLGHPALARRDATKCLADGTCADGR
jgi:hypothetical protein